MGLRSLCDDQYIEAGFRRWSEFFARTAKTGEARRFVAISPARRADCPAPAPPPAPAAVRQRLKPCGFCTKAPDRRRRRAAACLRPPRASGKSVGDEAIAVIIAMIGRGEHAMRRMGQYMRAKIECRRNASGASLASGSSTSGPKQLRSPATASFGSVNSVPMPIERQDET